MYFFQKCKCYSYFENTFQILIGILPQQARKLLQETFNLNFSINMVVSLTRVPPKLTSRKLRFLLHVAPHAVLLYPELILLLYDSSGSYV